MEQESLFTKAGEILRTIASHQGKAYQKYGEALEKFGTGEIKAGELFKTTADLYFVEAGRVSASVFEATSEVFQRALGIAGVKVLEEPAQRVDQKKAAKQ